MLPWKLKLGNRSPVASVSYELEKQAWIGWGHTRVSVTGCWVRSCWKSEKNRWLICTASHLEQRVWNLKSSSSLRIHQRHRQLPGDLLQVRDGGWISRVGGKCFPPREGRVSYSAIRGEGITKALSPRSPGAVQKKACAWFRNSVLWQRFYG